MFGLTEEKIVTMSYFGQDYPLYCLKKEADKSAKGPATMADALTKAASLESQLSRPQPKWNLARPLNNSSIQTFSRLQSLFRGASPLCGLPPEIVAQGMDFEDVGRNQLARENRRR